MPSSSSSARPRLVEEGEPIFDFDNGGGDDDHQQHTNTTRSSLATSKTKATKTSTFYSVGGGSTVPTDHYNDFYHGGDHVVASKLGGGGMSSLQRAAMKSNIKIKDDRKKLRTVTTTTTDDDSMPLGLNYNHQTPVASKSSSRPTVTSTSYVIGGGSNNGSGSGTRSHDQQRPSYQYQDQQQVYHPHHNYQHHLHNDNIGSNFRDAGHQATIMSPGHAHATQTGQFTVASTIPPVVAATQQQHRKDDDDDDDDMMMMMMMMDSDGDMNHYHHHHHQSGHQGHRHNQHQHQHQHNQHHVTQRSYEIGNDQTGSTHYHYHQEPSYPHISHADSAAAGSGGGAITTKAERMEGVEDHSEKPEIVVLDGANVAYAYAEVNSTVVSGPAAGLSTSTTKKTEPDVRGIQVAADHFLRHGVRVLVVLPQYFWKSTKFRPLAEDQLEILHGLKAGGLLVPSPPADDDDAYAITIAQREDSKSQRFPDRIKPGYVLSNDMFRDAQDRDETGNLRRWLQDGRHPDFGPGRISYTFFDNQSMNDRGEHVLDFQPNPRHPLVERLFKHS